MANDCTAISVCECQRAEDDCKRVVLTGGPGAGKTAILELVKRNFCEHVSVLPEAASIIFGGGFWRRDSIAAKKAAQRAIYYVQREQERLVEDEKKSAIVLCDRGTLDGLAYWPGSEEEFWREIGSTRAIELSRYAAIIHLRTPPLRQGYNMQNPVRIESAKQAFEIDEKIVQAWNGHPKRFFVESSDDFLKKVSLALVHIRNELPDCCRKHQITELNEKAGV